MVPLLHNEVLLFLLACRKKRRKKNADADEDDYGGKAVSIRLVVIIELAGFSTSEGAQIDVEPS